MSAFLEAFEAASKDDLADIEDQIADGEARLDSLRTAAKVLRAKLGIERPKVTRQTGTRAPRGAKPKTRELIYDLISTEGPGTVEQIATKLMAQGHDVNEHGVRLTVGKCDWFEKEMGTGRVLIATTSGGRD